MTAVRITARNKFKTPHVHTINVASFLLNVQPFPGTIRYVSKMILTVNIRRYSIVMSATRTYKSKVPQDLRSVQKLLLQ